MWGYLPTVVVIFAPAAEDNGETRGSEPEGQAQWQAGRGRGRKGQSQHGFPLLPPLPPVPSTQLRFVPAQCALPYYLCLAPHNPM